MRPPPITDRSPRLPSLISSHYPPAGGECGNKIVSSVQIRARKIILQNPFSDGRVSPGMYHLYLLIPVMIIFSPPGNGYFQQWSHPVVELNSWVRANHSSNVKAHQDDICAMGRQRVVE